MQHRYVGDIGDYVKLAILRALAPGRRLGVVWWMFPDENHSRDGRHIAYLGRPDEWRRFDPPLFDGLKAITDRNERNVQALEAGLMPVSMVFVSDPIPSGARPFTSRPARRERWLAEIGRRLADADLVFLDPGNGIAPERIKTTERAAAKSVLVGEIAALRRPGRAILAYHHQTRHKGGHMDELRHLGGRLSAAGLHVAGALRASSWSPRAFFLVDADPVLVARAEGIAAAWGDRITWHPHI